jgi:hypothetical protein
MRRALLALAVAAALAVAGLVVWVVTPSGEEPGAGTAAPREAAASAQRAAARARIDAATPACPSRVQRPFAPRTISIPGVTRSAQVVTPPRDAAGVPGIPPLNNAGKTVFAWDREQGISPGDRRGNVLLNAHTWPDGSALGNRLLKGLGRGDRIVVRGDRSLLCYRVTERVEVMAEDGLPRYYAKKGRPQLAIVVCSGRRLGPGIWEKRTIFFASPSP